MKITIRLYSRHDLDLMSIYLNDNFPFSKEMKKAVKAYVNGDSYEIDIPESEKIDTPPRVIQFHICFSQSSDAELIEWIKSITPGYRNSVLKNIFRNYMSEPIVSPYIKNKQ